MEKQPSAEQSAQWKGRKPLAQVALRAPKPEAAGAGGEEGKDFRVGAVSVPCTWNGCHGEKGTCVTEIGSERAGCKNNNKVELLLSKGSTKQ